MAHGQNWRDAVRIAIIVEGKTEAAFHPYLREFLRARLENNIPAREMPKLDHLKYDGRIPKEDKLKRLVANLLADRKKPADAVIALTDVYTGSSPPEFVSAADAKQKMSEWVGTETRFYPHVACHDFEAWLLPYWEKIQKLADSNRKSPGKNPETVNHGNPPAHRLQDVFIKGGKKKSYVKTVYAGRILKGEDLNVAIKACAELKAFVNTILKLCRAKLID